jgi:hypothetical protein
VFCTSRSTTRSSIGVSPARAPVLHEHERCHGRRGCTTVRRAGIVRSTSSKPAVRSFSRARRAAARHRAERRLQPAGAPPVDFPGVWRGRRGVWTVNGLTVPRRSARRRVGGGDRCGDRRRLCQGVTRSGGVGAGSPARGGKGQHRRHRTRDQPRKAADDHMLYSRCSTVPLRWTPPRRRRVGPTSSIGRRKFLTRARRSLRATNWFRPRFRWVVPGQPSPPARLGAMALAGIDWSGDGNRCAPCPRTGQRAGAFARLVGGNQQRGTGSMESVWATSARVGDRIDDRRAGGVGGAGEGLSFPLVPPWAPRGRVSSLLEVAVGVLQQCGPGDPLQRLPPSSHG